MEERSVSTRELPPRLPGESDLNYERFTRWLALGQGLPQSQVAELLAIPQSHVSRLMAKYAWRARAALVPSIQAPPEDPSRQLTQRQEEVKQREWALHEELLRAAAEGLRRWGESNRIPTAGEIVKLVEMAARLGRLSTGMPLTTTELSGSAANPVRIELEVALDRIYGTLRTQSEPACRAVAPPPWGESGKKAPEPVEITALPERQENRG